MEGGRHGVNGQNALLLAKEEKNRGLGFVIHHHLLVKAKIAPDQRLK